MDPNSLPADKEDHLTVLFVCSGNTCRSPMAEAIARRMAEEGGLDGVTFRSAGTSTVPGLPASQGAQAAAGMHGLTLESHRSTPLSQALITGSGLILTMGSSHLIRVVELGGEGKSYLLGAYAGGEPSGADGPTVPDPFGGDEGVYEATFQLLEGLVKGVLARIGSEKGGV